MSDARPFDSERLQMRATVIGDAEALLEIYSDADLMTWWSSAPKTSVEEVRTYLTPFLALPDARSWSICEKGSDRAIGTLSAIARRPGVTEIGYSLARAHWGKGYAAEAVAGLIERLFEEGNRRVFADTDPDNAASNRLLERLGFTCEGRLRAEWETHIGVRDSLIWGLLRAEWGGHPPAG